MKSKIDTPWALRNNSLKLSLIRSEGKDIGETFATIKVAYLALARKGEYLE